PELTVELDFTKRKYEGPPRVAIAEYRLSGHPQVPQHDVLVNEGWLEVRELSQVEPRVTVTTTKSIKFRPAYGGPWLALISCHVGYLSMVEDLVCCASKAPPKDGEEDEGYPDIPFPGLA